MRGLVIVAAVLAGCSGSFLGGCKPFDSVEWTDPALYDALGTLDPREEPAAPGILDAAIFSMAHGNVTLLRWTPTYNETSQRELTFVELTREQITTQATGDAEARAALGAFLVNLTDLDESERQAYVDAALRNRSKAVEMISGGTDLRVVAWRYEARAPPSTHAEALAREWASNSTLGYASTGQARIDAGSYTFALSIPVREVTLDGIPLRVDGAGRASAAVGERRDADNGHEALDRILEALRAHGLPAPVQPTTHTGIC